MRLIARLLISLMTCTGLPAAAYEIAGVDIPDTIELADSDSNLVLNGAGIREKFFLDIYVGALYLPSRTSDVDAILDDSGPASVLMHFLYSKVSKQKITDGWRDGLRANLTADELRAIRAALDKFNTLFLDVHKGDVVRIDYRPATGTAVSINGEWRGSVTGEAFFRALLKVWLGARPVSNPLKKAMLGVKD